MLGLDKKLANAKSDKERVRIQTQMIEALKEENAKLKEQLRVSEEVENVIGSGSSNEGIDAKVEQRIEELETMIYSSKKSTASVRTEISLLKRIRKLKMLNYQKDLKIKELEDSDDLEEIGKAIDEITEIRQRSELVLNRLVTQSKKSKK